MWREGSLKVNNSEYRYWMKVYEEGSRFGIAAGRISKLMLKRGDKVAANYDRGWDLEPADPDTQKAVGILLKSSN